jgi:hypothetical protein
MKIIAGLSTNKFLVELTEAELNKISGLNRAYYQGNPYRLTEVFDVDKNWEYLEGIFKKKKELDAAARNLRSLADMIESVKVPVIEEEKIN